MAQAKFLLSGAKKSQYSSLCRTCKLALLSKNGSSYLKRSPSLNQRVASDILAQWIHTSSLHCDSVSAEVGGSSINISTGKFARLASGSALVKSGSTSVLVTAVSEYKADQNASWLPLQVDYRERGSAANKIPQTFFRRELRPSTKEYLASRFIDRSIRPMFPSGYFYNTQIICNMLAVDGNQDHEILAVNGAAAALMLSDIPWNGPIGAIRVCLYDGKFCINPSIREQNTCQLNLIVACTKDRIVMVEGSAEEVSEETVCEAVKIAFDEAQPLLESLWELTKYRKAPIRESALFLPSDHLLETVQSMCREKVMSILATTSHTKMSRDGQLFSLLDDTKEAIAATHAESGERVADAFWRTVKLCMKELVLEKGIRCDGRGFTELRNIECEVDTFKPLHGTAVFRRGESQVLCTVTFDSPGSAAKADILQMLLGAQKSSSFMVHYEFPPFATNSIGTFMSHNRREAGHGALAEKALSPLIPKNFPFTIRLNSQVLDSNGSTSMATICGGSLALFDAGVPMPRPAAGVACGLVTKTHPDTGEIDKYQILTDLLGIEDANGNMDFKIGGTREGITSLQVDVKEVLGIPFNIFEETLMQSKVARHQVLDIMDSCLSAPREEIKKNRPVHTTITVPPDKLGRLLGVGGRRLKGIAEDTGANFTILEDENISIFAPSKEAIDEFQERVDNCLKEDDHEFEIGSVLEAKVMEVRDNGIMMELAPRVYTLLHISKISHGFVSHPSDVGLNIGEKVNVKYLGKDFLGRHQISRKALMKGDNSSESDEDFEVGSVIDAKVIEIKDNGIVVELAPNVYALLHISKISHDYITHPSKLGVKVGENLNVKYMGKDPQGKHQISRKALMEPSSTSNTDTEPSVQFEVGQEIEATVKDIRDYGIMVELAPGVVSLLHKRNIAHEFVSHPSQVGLNEGDKVMVQYVGNDSEGRHEVSRKALLKPNSSKTAEKTDKVAFIVGQIIPARVKAIRDYGLIMELAPGITALLHIKNLSHEFVSHPSQIGLKVGDRINVQYLGKDVLGRREVSRKALHERCSNSPTVNPASESTEAPEIEFEVGQVIPATVKSVREFGVIVELADGVTTILHNKNLAHEFVSHPSQIDLEVGDRVDVKYLGKDSQGRHEVSRKELTEREPPTTPANNSEPPSVRLEKGQVIEATVKATRDYGIMVELAPGVVSLLHKKNLAHHFVSHPSEIGLKEGDKVNVKYLGPNISRKALIEADVPNVEFEIGQVVEATVKGTKVMIEPAPGVVYALDKGDASLEASSGDKMNVMYLGKSSKGRHQFSRIEPSTMSSRFVQYAKESLHSILPSSLSSFFKEPSVQFEVGQEIEATVKDIGDYGIMVELAPGVLSLLHKKNLSEFMVDHPSELGFEPGDVVMVKYLGRDNSENHRISLSENLEANSPTQSNS